ncbi:MAG: GNAT family N-acetyltransferase [Victivallales bacterium]|jgi:predicted GNAT family N-acyltransferase|nr:GNAT family N-acetyltransferase [Victivallales bacterium]MBT7299977.1 GNAT family N-acetyltransferase [Victivallales bacterium]
MQVNVVPHGSAAYAQTVKLRQDMLRTPLGLTLTPAQLAAETDQVHLAAFDGEDVVGCLVLKPLPDGSMQMRQVAVLPARQGEGIGRQLVLRSEEECRKRNVSRLILHARETARGFYLKLGYDVEGEPFEEVSVPHIGMAKQLD